LDGKPVPLMVTVEPGVAVDGVTARLGNTEKEKP
jgi:hypothetical protein